jgi:hypothetical protein
MLIGENTRHKHKYVRWEAEIAIEKGCRMIAANLDKWRFCNPERCPPVIRDIGALFVPFSPQIIAYALENYVMPDPPVGARNYIDSVYKKLGYTLFGKLAVRPPKPPPFAASSGR